MELDELASDPTPVAPGGGCFGAFLVPLRLGGVLRVSAALADKGS